MNALSNLYGSSSATGHKEGTAQMSGAQQFGTIASGIGSMLGGAGNFLKFMPSDIELKHDIEQVGTLFDGQPVYGYFYKGNPTYTIGLIAQEVEKRTPEAVIELNGFKAVDYRLATKEARALKAAA